MKNKKEYKITIKLLKCIVYIIIITILFVYTYKLYKSNEMITPWQETSSVEDYTYIEITKICIL